MTSQKFPIHASRVIINPVIRPCSSVVCVCVCVCVSLTEKCNEEYIGQDYGQCKRPAIYPVSFALLSSHKLKTLSPFCMNFTNAAFAERPLWQWDVVGTVPSSGLWR